MFITALTILLAEAGQGSITTPQRLMQARLADTWSGAVLGLAGAACLHSPRFPAVAPGPRQRRVNARLRASLPSGRPSEPCYAGREPVDLLRRRDPFATAAASPISRAPNPGQEQCRVFREVARRWRDTVNRHGGDVTLVEPPSIGIRGNTHFPMSDVNNQEVAQQMASWLQKKGLE